MSTREKHHFVPRFYLKGFTKESSVDGKLWVVDLKNRKCWQNTPAKAACEGDFYKGDLGPDVDPMWLERALGSVVEPLMAEVLRFILDTKEIPPCGQAHDVFLNLVATSFVRGRAMREQTSLSIDANMRELLADLASSDADNAFLKALKDTGLSAEEFLSLNNQGAFQYDFDRVTYLKAMIDATSLVLKAFARRDWTVRIVADDAPDLICSDAPVGIIALAKEVPLVWFDPNALVVMPLSRRVAVIGSLKDVEHPDFLGTMHVARINTSIIRAATEAYCSEPAFTVANEDGVQRVEM